jgi:hypothetical protein
MDLNEYERACLHELDLIGLEARGRSGCDIHNLLKQCLLPAMMKDAVRSVSAGGDPALFLPGDLDHIADWLASAVAANLKWLRNLDAAGVPRKFSKLSSVTDVHAEAHRGLDRMLREAASKPAVDGEEVIIAALDGGYTLVSLRSSASLDRESKEMQHCVGLGGYDAGVAAGTISILSLRDQKGRPHVTMELRVHERLICQVKGKQNRFPASRYFDLLIPWITGQGFEISEQELAGGYFRQRSGPIRHIAELSDDETLEGDLTLRFDGDADIDLVLPKGLRIGGDLVIRSEYASDKNVYFGEGTVVGGALETFGAVVKGVENVTSQRLRLIAGAVAQVPDGSRIPGELYVSGAVLGDLLERAVFENGVEIRDIHRVKVPATISVRGPLAIVGAEVVSVENGASFNRGVAITGSVKDCVLTVGSGVTIGEAFNVSNCALTLNRGLRVGGDLSVQFTELERFPSDMDVGGLRINQIRGVSSIPASAVIRGNVSILKSDITSLCGRTYWPGDLRIPKMVLTHLPYGLSVEGSLEVSWVPLVEFPAAMRIGGSLTAVGCLAGKIPADALIGGGIDLSRNEAVSIPDGMTVGGDLKLDGAYLNRMPVGVTVAGMLHLAKYPVDRITRFITAESYVMSDSFVIDLSDLDEVDGSVWVAAKDASKLPEGMRVGGKLIVQGKAEGARLPEGISVGEYVRADDSEMLASLVPLSAKLGGTRCSI